MASLTLPAILRQFEGSKTDQLVREPGGFGLGQVPATVKPDATTDLVCGFCSTGCSLKVHLRDGQAINLSPTPDYPVNLGMACPKGWEALTPLEASNRATTPMLKDASGKMVPVSWQVALEEFRNRFATIKEKHGGDSLAFISTGQICTEEMAFLGTLAKSGLGFAHGDGNTRQCMATSVVSYTQSFGFDAPPYTYADFEESDCIILIGSNLTIAHPIMWQRVLQNPHNPDIIVIDPRRTETAAAATQHLPILPKSDLALLYGIAHLLIQNDAIDQDYIAQNTTGFAEFKAFLAPFTLAATVVSTGISSSEIERLVHSIQTRERVSFWWTMGVNQSHQATRTAQAIINLALMTGNIGRPGTGANSITGQCNAMGSRLFSNTSSLLGGRDYNNPEHRREVAEISGIPEEKIPTEKCLAYDQIIDGIESGRIKGLWILATNTAHSWTGGDRLSRLFEKLDFLVVQDMYHDTLTAQHADLILPAAGWGEKDGTFINSERRIGLAKKVRRAPGVALADFHIFQAIAHACDCAEDFAQWKSPEDAFKILAKLSKNRPCDFSGIEDYAFIEKHRGVQWPLPEGEIPEPERRLFADGNFFTPDQKARFFFEAPIAPPEVPSKKYPFTLLTGRGSSAQWHTQTRTGESAILKKLHPSEIYCEVNPADAKELAISHGSLLIVQSARGSLRALAKITAAVKSGEVFIPMHFVETNRLTYPVVDPLSRQPSYKHCAVLVTPA